jgi:uncharacterized protein
MSEELPQFKYHPDPVGNGLVIKSDRTCQCCGKGRGFIYRGPIYSVHDLDGGICPWCIADGSAAAKFNATFTDDVPLLEGGDLDPAIVEEIIMRTPGYIGWQQEAWQTHCSDACAYMGFPTHEELNGVLAEAVITMTEDLGIPEKTWQTMHKAFVPGGFQPQGRVGLYKFRCLHCGTHILTCDSS